LSQFGLELGFGVPMHCQQNYIALIVCANVAKS
jgi:hypothetical protein